MKACSVFNFIYSESTNQKTPSCLDILKNYSTVLCHLPSSVIRKKTPSVNQRDFSNCPSEILQSLHIANPLGAPNIAEPR